MDSSRRVAPISASRVVLSSDLISALKWQAFLPKHPY